MYKVLCDGLPLFDSCNEELVLIEPKVVLEVNTSGSFTFKMPPNHPQFNLPKKMRSCIEVWHDDEQIFAGRPISDTVDFYNRKNIKCEGQLAYLNDSIQRPAEYHDMTVRGYLETLIAVHNSQVDESRQFEVGIVTVKDNNDSLYRYTNYNSTWTEIKEDLIDDLGGYIRVRNQNGHRYIDYIADFSNVCTQSIEFGENLLDCSRNIDLTDIATAIIPLGCRLEESDIDALEKRLTVESVNDGLDYIVNSEAVEKYGFIVKTVIWDNVTTPEMLLSRGKHWLESEQFENMILNVKAVDLHYTDEQIEQFKLFDLVPVHSSPHGLNRRFPLSKITIYLNNLSANKFVLGAVEQTTLSSKNNKTNEEIKKVINSIVPPNAILRQAVDNATQLIQNATNGFVTTTLDKNGNPTELLIMDTKNKETATKVWRWNVNGLGYSSSGYNGTYETAITMDGWIVGDRIAANSIDVSKLSVEYTETLQKEMTDIRLGANSDTDEKLKKYWTIEETKTEIKNSSDNIVLTVTSNIEQYVDNELLNYYTKSEIDIKSDEIVLSVQNSSKEYTDNTLLNYPNKSEMETSISMKLGELTLSVTDGNEGSQISLKVGETVISSGEIKLTGFVKFDDLSTSGSTTISGSNITTGTIDANKVKVTNLDASNITAGTISADRISGGTIDASAIDVTNINIDNVKYGSVTVITCSGDSYSPTIKIGTSTRYDASALHLYGRNLYLGAYEGNSVYIARRGTSNQFAFDMKVAVADAVFRPAETSSNTSGGKCSIGTSNYYFKSAYLCNLYVGRGSISLGCDTYAKLGFFGTTPITKKTVNKLSTSATLSTTITKVNDLLTALKDYGLIASS